MRIYGFERFGGPEVQAHLEVPAPSAGPGQVVVELRAAGVNPADIKVREGRRQGTVEVNFPMALGREAAGVVIEAGSGVDFEAGELVFGATASGTGALADLVILDAAGTARVPAGVTAEQAACIPVAVGTALDALTELALPEGGTLLVLGAGGGVGTSAIQLARHLGLTVIGVASLEKEYVVTSLDARHVESGPGWVTRARAACASIGVEGVDGIIDAVGGDVLREAAPLLRTPGAIRSTASPAVAAELGGSGVTRRRTRAVFAELADLVAQGVVDPLISFRFDLDHAAEAVADVEGGHALGKVVVVGAPGGARVHRYQLDYGWAGDAWDGSQIATLLGQLEGPGAVAAVRAWWESLAPCSGEPRHPCRVTGGVTIELRADSPTRLTLAIGSAGEDAFDSIAHCAETVADVATTAADATTTLTWTQLPLGED